MNYLKRALLSLTRRQGKSLILLLIVFILSNIMAGSIAISQASKNVERTMKEQLGANATIELDWEKVQNWTNEDWTNMKMITPEDVEEIGVLPQVKYYDYNTDAYLTSTEIKNYDPNMDYENCQGCTPYFYLRGVQYEGILDIVKGDATLVEGRVFTKEEVANGDYVGLISDKVAEVNNLHIGELVPLVNLFQMWDEQGQMSNEIRRDVLIEIIGIYTPKIVENQDQNLKEGGWIDYSLFNRVYVPNKVSLAESRWQTEQYMIQYPDSGANPDQIYITPSFVLNSPEEVESFKNDAKTLLPDYYKITVSSDAYDAVAGPIKFVGQLSNTILYVAIGATILILGLVVILFLRDRKHELGVYLALGERKWKVVGQIVIEVLAVAFIGITLSLFSGNSIAEATSQSMIDMGVGATGTTDQPIYYYNPTNISQEDVINAYAIEFNLDYVLILYGVGLSTVLVSTIGPMIYILRLKPKKIMM